MYICDCHCDTLSELYKHNYDFYSNQLHIDIKRIIANGGGLQFCAMFVPTREYRYYGGIRYTLGLLDKYRTEVKKMQAQGLDIFPVLTKADLDHVLEHQVATLLAIEEGGALDGSLAALRCFYELGVRAMTLVWSNRNDIADGVNETCSKGGLTTFGRQVVAEMNRLGMAVDISHISTYGFWDTLATSTKPLIATHSNALQLCSHPRNLDDKQLQALSDCGGFVGINFSSHFLENDWHKACIHSVYRHLAYMMDVMGNDEHVGFGSDFDGINDAPYNLQGVQDFVPLIDYLSGKFSDATLEKITHGNCLSYLKKIL